MARRLRRFWLFFTYGVLYALFRKNYFIFAFYHHCLCIYLYLVFIMNKFKSKLPKQTQLLIYAFLNQYKKESTQAKEFEDYLQYCKDYKTTPVHFNTYKRYKRNYNRVLRKKRFKEI